jgi:hypothetical protein
MPPGASRGNRLLSCGSAAPDYASEERPSTEAIVEGRAFQALHCLRNIQCLANSVKYDPDTWRRACFRPRRKTPTPVPIATSIHVPGSGTALMLPEYDVRPPRGRVRKEPFPDRKAPYAEIRGSTDCR